MSETKEHPAVEKGPAWDIARLFPDQGQWSEGEYLALNTNRLVEFSDGVVEFLPMPTVFHQRIVALFYTALVSFVTAHRLGEVLFAPLRVQLWEGKFREPVLVFLKTENASRITRDYWIGADLVVEVVSDDDRRRDLEIKRGEYARAGIPEYWIVDPQFEKITVLALEGEVYVVHGEYPRGAEAESRLLPEFKLEVASVFSVKA
jgi:Uma2 family endonuclease